MSFLARPWPFNRFLQTEPFLVTIPDLISFAVCSSELLGLHSRFFHFSVYTLDFSLLGLHVRSSSNDTFFASFRTIHSSFKRKKVGEGIWTLDPWGRETYFTWPDHGAPQNQQTLLKKELCIFLRYPICTESLICIAAAYVLVGPPDRLF